MGKNKRKQFNKEGAKYDKRRRGDDDGSDADTAAAADGSGSDGDAKSKSGGSDWTASGSGAGSGRAAKRKVAVVFCYRGSGFFGLQMNPGAETVEKVVREAIIAAGGISDANSQDLRKVGWSRAARTDKGVHAAGNVICLKMVIAAPINDAKAVPVSDLVGADTSALVGRINAALPDSVRVLDVFRVMGKFDAKRTCTDRTYEYLLPAAALQGMELQPKHLPARSSKDVDAGDGAPAHTPDTKSDAASSSAAATVAAPAAATGTGTAIAPAATAAAPAPADANAASSTSSNRLTFSLVKGTRVVASGTAAANAAYASTAASVAAPVAANADPTGSLLAAERKQFFAYRPSPAAVTNANRILRRYVGTHNFHNFTAKRAGTDQSCMRFIMDIKIVENDIYTDSRTGIQYLRILIHGQSFMLHQIRKMIGLMVLIARGVVSEAIFDYVFSPHRRFAVPKAPACGLLLDRCHFRAYDDTAAHDEQETKRLAAEAAAAAAAAATAAGTAPAVAAPVIQRPTFTASFNTHAKTITAFKEQRLYPEICDRFTSDDELLHWLQHTSEPGLYGHELGADAPQPSNVPFNKREKKPKPESAAAAAAAGSSAASTATAAGAGDGKPRFDDPSYEATRARIERQNQKKGGGNPNQSKNKPPAAPKSNISFKSSGSVTFAKPTAPAAVATIAATPATAAASTTSPAAASTSAASTTPAAASK